MSSRSRRSGGRFSGPEFVARLRARDPEALREVAEAYLPQILRAARAAGLDAQRAEDVAQATLAAFVERAAHFEGRSHVRTFLFGILYHKLAQSQREAARNDREDPIDETVAQRFAPDGSWQRPPRPADADVYAAEIVELVERGLAELPFKQRMAFLLREVHGFTTGEICNILQVSGTHVGVLLFRARNRLREYLEAHGVRGPRGAGGGA
ncbi:MAG: sigma-70 family RNA polymerase sigma factor [Acidobacteria bacterium]|nr:MAG: sigma-70 family RNA polymerase sigma factor [Acidobacteriota bacterium]